MFLCNLNAIYVLKVPLFICSKVFFFVIMKIIKSVKSNIKTRKQKTKGGLLLLNLLFVG